jgi:hypothetical protein
MLYRHGCDKSLGLSESDVTQHPLLLVERSYNPPAIRQQCLELLFEEIGVPATFLAKDAVLAGYACGRTSATVVDVGYSGTTVTPVVDGYVETAGIRRNPVGIQAMDELILQNLDKLYHQQVSHHNNNKQPEVLPLYQIRGPKLLDEVTHFPTCPRRAPMFHQAARNYLARECRDAGAGAGVNTTPGAAAATVVAVSAAPAGGAGASSAPTVVHVPAVPFTLPDGTTVDVPSSDRFATANLVLGGTLDDQNTRRRDVRYQRTREQITMYIENATTISRSGKDDGVDSSGKSDRMDVVDNNGDEMKHDEHTGGKYSEAAAVGISKRRTQRDRPSPAISPSSSRPPVFYNRHLQRACVKNLQSLHDQYLTSSPIANMVCDAAYRCEREQQAALLGNVVLTGGGTCLGPMEQSVPEYVREQIEALIHIHTPGWRVKVLTPGLSDRAIGSWLGGSILASMGTFHQMWITKAEYEDWGTAIVNRKCP